MNDQDIKNYCAAAARLKKLEEALKGFDLFLDVWDGKDLKTITTVGQRDTLFDVNAAAETYLDGFRAALDSPVEIPANE